MQPCLSLLGHSLNRCSFVVCSHQPNFLHSPMCEKSHPVSTFIAISDWCLLLGLITPHWFPSVHQAGCPPVHPPMSWLACLTCAPPLPIHQDCSCISHTQVQPLDIEEHYEDTSHQFLVSSPQTLSVQREASPWCYFITSLLTQCLFMRIDVPLIKKNKPKSNSNTKPVTFSVKPVSIMY